MAKNRSTLEFRSDSPIGQRTGISLHCHTKYSKEFLDFVPYYAEMYPVVSSIFRLACRQFEKTNGKRPNFNLGHWEPPLEAHQLIESESESLRSLGLDAIVSITDHDSISGGLDLRSAGLENHPISMEWTVPFGEAYFHVGVHNMPHDRADDISKALLAYTFSEPSADEDDLGNVLTLLNESPEILIVLNHPFWDIEMIGQERHDAALSTFTKMYGHFFHALEVNGFRPWAENRLAIELAEELSLPIVSGGDRHCLHHNSMINVTDARSFSEFVEEVRVDKHSRVLILPEYSKSLTLRQIRSIAQIMGQFPDFSDSRREWPQRVYFDWEDGQGLQSLASRWGGKAPMQYRWAVRAIGLLGSPWLERAWHLVDPAERPGKLTGVTNHKTIVDKNLDSALFLEPRVDSLQA